MENRLIPYSKQTIEADDLAAVAAVLQSDFLTTGPEVTHFEAELAAACDARFAVVCNSGTAALHLAGMALGLGPQEAIVTTPITFLATANSARFCSAEVLFADVEPQSVNLDPEAVEALLRQNSSGYQIRALFPVHFGGQPANMAAFAELGRKYNVAIVEDASHALGASYKTPDGRRVKVGSCEHSAMTIVSFHPVKHITTGEGGAITTNDEKLYRKLQMLRSHGMVRDSQSWTDRNLGFDAHGTPNPWYYEMQELGYNYRITDLQCALGRNQLKKLDRFVHRRREIAHAYRERFRRQSARFQACVQTLSDGEGIENAYHLFPVLIDFKSLRMTRAQLMLSLREKGVGTQVHYIPVHQQPYYAARYGVRPPGTFPHAERYYSQCVSLPIYPAMTNEDLDRSVEAIVDIVG